MTQGMKSVLYRALKDSGAPLDKHYREYTTAELEEIAQAHGVTVAAPAPSPRDTPPPRVDDSAELRAQIEQTQQMLLQLTKVITLQARQQELAPPAPAAPAPQPAPVPQPEPAPALHRPDPREHAGVQLNQQTENGVLHVDEAGNEWYQVEVAKPGYAKPRGRRVLTVMDSGTQQQTIRTSDGYTETFEIPGDPKFAKETKIKVTLPSFQTGIFKPKGMPFKIHTYQGARGFDLEDVNAFYGGADLVPDSIKRTYVSSDLCYDMTTTIRAIQDEYRERVLRKETLR